MQSRFLLVIATIFSFVSGWMAAKRGGVFDPLFTFMAFPFLCVGAIIVFWQSIQSWGWLRALKGWAALSLFAYIIEIIGVKTGLPYGSFRYGTGMGPLIFDVPLLLPLAWVPLLLGSWQIALRLTAYKASRILITIFLLVSVDLVLDPGAVALGLWTYISDLVVVTRHEQYYGVLWVNFVGWIMSAGVGAYIINVLTSIQVGRLLWWLFPMFTGIGFWIGVNAWHQNFIPMCIGFSLLLVLAVLIKRDEFKAL